MTTNTKDVLFKALAIIKDPDNWTKGYYAKNENGKNTLPDDPTAVKYSLLGALWKASYELDPTSIKKSYWTTTTQCKMQIKSQYQINKTIQKHMSNYLSTGRFNDAPETKHEDVIHILEKTIANL